MSSTFQEVWELGGTTEGSLGTYKLALKVRDIRPLMLLTQDPFTDFHFDYRRITRFCVKHEGASQRGLRIFA